MGNTKDVCEKSNMLTNSCETKGCHHHRDEGDRWNLGSRLENARWLKCDPERTDNEGEAQQ